MRLMLLFIHGYHHALALRAFASDRACMRAPPLACESPRPPSLSVTRPSHTLRVARLLASASAAPRRLVSLPPVAPPSQLRRVRSLFALCVLPPAQRLPWR